MEFLRWYGAMLRSLLPSSLRAMFGGSASGLIVSADLTAPPACAVVAQRSRGGTRTLGTLGALAADLSPSLRRGVTLVVTAPGRLVLSRMVTLPLAAERHLATVLTFEMDRLTPFAAGEVWYRTDIINRRKAAGSIALRLAVLPRAKLLPLLDALAQADLHPGRIEAQDAAGIITLPLDPGAPPARRIEAALAALCAILALVCLLIPLSRQQIELHRLATREKALVPRLHAAETLRGRLDRARNGAATLAAEQAREGDALAALAAITTAVPDGSFLTDLTLRHRIATLDGESPNAAGLVAAFSANPAFADPSFAAPVTRALNAKADIVSIRVRVRRHEAP
ncbi:PilN domain-containing protein [Acidiphilium sp.]|uniref:PilN domain-containing protein n=1 Tax=Acidiphilium sp. TaxID=527 RepID=UPI003D05AF7D